MLSPALFSLFVRQLANHLTQKDRLGIQLVLCVMEVFILLLADEVALLSTPTGLQNQLHCLKTCCQLMKMEVNEDKTKNNGIQNRWIHG